MHRLALFSIVYMLLVFSASVKGQTKITVYKDSGEPGVKKDTVIKNPYKYHFSGGESAVKINFSAMFKSDYCLSYEKKIYQNFSFEVSAGVTYYDRLMELLDNDRYRPPAMVRGTRKYKIGPSLKVAVRHYFNRNVEEIEGPYVGVEASYRRFNTTIRSTYTSPALNNEYNIQKEIRAMAGWQFDLWDDIGLYDVALGVGYRVNDRRYLGEGVFNTIHTQKLLTAEKGYPILLISFKLGFLLSY